MKLDVRCQDLPTWLVPEQHELVPKSKLRDGRIEGISYELSDGLQRCCYIAFGGNRLGDALR